MVEINNLTRFAVDKKFFLRVAKKVLKGENMEKENLSLAFVSCEAIRIINKKYRGENKPTDVLSFAKISSGRREFSEVIICPAILKKTAKFSHQVLKMELSKALIHGILHTLGYDHEISKKEEKLMLKKQNYYLSKFKIRSLQFIIISMSLYYKFYFL